MSKHQTRRSLSFERRLHEITTQHAAALKQSTSHYVSELIRRDLIAAGIEVPAAPLHVVIDDERVGRWWCKPKPLKPPKPPKPEKLLVERPEKPPRPPKPEPPSCWWCRKGFAAHETAIMIHDRTLHARCARQARL